MMSLSSQYIGQGSLMKLLISYLDFRLHHIFPQQTQPHGIPQGDIQHDPELSPLLTTLLVASLSPATRALYRCTVVEFCHSCQSNQMEKNLLSLASTSQVLRFITTLFHQGLSCASICSQLSSISFWHKLHSWPSPVNTFVVQKCLKGISKVNPPSDPVRLPVTPAML